MILTNGLTDDHRVLAYGDMQMIGRKVLVNDMMIMFTMKSMEGKCPVLFIQLFHVLFGKNDGRGCD